MARWPEQDKYPWVWAVGYEGGTSGTGVPAGQNVLREMTGEEDDRHRGLSYSPTISFRIIHDVPAVGSNARQKTEHDKKIGGGTMSRSGAKCPCCDTIMTMEDIRLEGCSGRLDTLMTAVVTDCRSGKEYRLPTRHELKMAAEAETEVEKVFADLPFGLPTEPLPNKEAPGSWGRMTKPSGNLS